MSTKLDRHSVYTLISREVLVLMVLHIQIPDQMVNTKMSDFLLEFIRGQFNYPEDDSFIM